MKKFSEVTLKRKNERKPIGKIARVVSVCALSAILACESFVPPMASYAAEGETQDIATITISTEELEALVSGGDYLFSATDGVESSTVGASLISDGELVGAYESAKSPKITKARRKLFKKAFKGFVGSEVTPVAYLAKQIVAGTNHLYLCRIKAVVPDAQEYYCFVSIYEDLEGNVSINEMINTEAATGINELMGGWSQASNVKVTKSIKKAFKKAMNGLVGVDYKPVAVLSQQVVAGMNYCILCESKVVYPGAQTGYSLVYIYKGLDGSAELKDIVRLDEKKENDI
ncbi:MAG: hypothetical protein K6E85_07045 [Lachnospiraceae bacterium]|nr:hypothetical protein [Lachnospiraceae bacterium]